MAGKAQDTTVDVGTTPDVATTAEHLAAAADDAVQNRPDAVPAVPRHVVADRYVHLTHPDHGEAVVFVPGERLPSWAVDELEAAAGGSGTP